MNDDFMKKFQKEPDPSFVRTLYQQLITSERRKPMVQKKIRFAITSFAALMILAGVLLTTSQTVRAAFRELLMVFNGVEVYRNPETGNLEASGNLDAIKIQKDNIIGIESADGTELEVVAVKDVEARPVPVEELLASHPDFAVPSNIPPGYVLNPNGLSVSDGGLGISWHNSSGKTITLHRDPLIEPEINTMDKGAAGIQVIMEDAYQLVPASDGSMDAVYTWAEGDYYYRLTATDESISRTALEQMR